MPHSAVERGVELDTAEKLIDWLEPARDRWGEDPQDWLFRGHGDSAYQLLPSALRDGAKPVKFLIRGQWTPGTRPTQDEQCQAEFELIRRFFRHADVGGLPIPEDSQRLREIMNRRESPPPQEWPSQELGSLVALAQHYGVPTRLLDWTRKPLIAAYFAAEGAASAVDKAETEGKPVPDKWFSIWALRRRFGGDRGFLEKARVTVFSAPRAGNQNLHLQSGMFTLHREPADPKAKPDLRTLDGVIESAGLPEGAFPLLREARVPYAAARAVMRRLRDRFVQGSTVYAGYDGVKRSVLEGGYRS